MFAYGCLPLSYAHLPLPGRLPPIREYHCFHAPPWWSCAPPWAAAGALGRPMAAAGALGRPMAAAGALGRPMAAAGALGPPMAAAGALGPPMAAAGALGPPWPEGESLQAELRWGRVERTRGPRLPLPDSVLRQLRRAYGTYPRTDVRIARRGGRLVLRAEPHAGQPEYRLRRRVRRPPAGSDGANPGRAESRAERRPGPAASGRAGRDR